MRQLMSTDNKTVTVTPVHVDGPVVPLERAQGRNRTAAAEHYTRSRGYFSSRDIRRSASGLPPVWQVGQYWSAESAKETSRTVSPQTGQGWPARPCTRRPAFFSALSSPAASPADRATASLRALRIAVYSPATSSGVRLAASLKGDIFAACST